jgi:hypothetical protein
MRRTGVPPLKMGLLLVAVGVVMVKTAIPLGVKLLAVSPLNLSVLQPFQMTYPCSAGYKVASIMTTQAVSDRREKAVEQASWVPMIIIALAQIQLIFNVNTLQVSIGSIVDDFNTTPSSVSTALVVYSLGVAGFVMLGAKLDRLLGSRLVFQLGVIVHGGAMGLMAIAPRRTR